MNDLDIKIVENFLERDDFDYVYNYALSMENWTIESSTDDSECEFLSHELTDVEYFNTYLFEKITSYLGKKYEIQKIYLNGQWSGREGDIHSDYTHKTILIYVSYYEFGWGGFTEFIFPDLTQKIIAPIQNRMVCFDGNILHKGYSFVYQNCPMRISLAYKLV